MNLHHLEEAIKLAEEKERPNDKKAVEKFGREMTFHNAAILVEMEKVTVTVEKW